MYNEDQFLMISGLQHFAFCKRQWALIHIEQIWKENYLTIDGNIFHQNAHKGNLFEKRDDILITRGMRIHSYKLGVSGNCDVVEFHKTENGIQLHNYEGAWEPIPIEYKRGKSKEIDADELQLCCEAMCLEEMLLCHIKEGYLYYGQTRRRTKVLFTDELRNKVVNSIEEMHQLFSKFHTPKAKYYKACESCSIVEYCIPKLERMSSVSNYIEDAMEEI